MTRWPSSAFSTGSWVKRRPREHRLIRILLLSHYAVPHLGGIETMLDSLARGLREQGHEVVHVASDALRPDDPPGEPGADGVRVERVAASNVLEQRLEVPYPLFSPALIGVLRRELARADVVHAHGFLYLSCVAGLVGARRARRRPARVLTEQVAHVDYDSVALDALERAAVASVGRLCARSAEAIVSINTRVEQQMRSLAPGALHRWIPNCVDTRRFRPPSERERAELRAGLGWDEHPRVLFVGRLVSRKGVDAAIAATRAAAGAFELAVVGPGEAKGLRQEHVEPLGAVTPARMADLMRAADALVLPSRGEGFPVAAGEALACGLPVALAPDPAYEPYLDGAAAGVRELPPDPTDVAALLADLVQPEARARAGADAAAHAQEAFSPAAAAAAHTRLYTEVLTGRRNT